MPQILFLGNLSLQTFTAKSKWEDQLCPRSGTNTGETRSFGPFSEDHSLALALRKPLRPHQICRSGGDVSHMAK